METAAAAEESFPGGTDPRITSMERNIQFLQQQHRETLEKLHAEIEYLRRQNKGEEVIVTSDSVIIVIEWPSNLFTGE